jgi:antitoxin HigA-1
MLGPTTAIHPGEILRMEFLASLNLSAYTVAKQCKVPRARIERLTRGRDPP